MEKIAQAKCSCGVKGHAADCFNLRAFLLLVKMERELFELELASWSDPASPPPITETAENGRYEEPDQALVKGRS